MSLDVVPCIEGEFIKMNETDQNFKYSCIYLQSETLTDRYVKCQHRRPLFLVSI
jgi:hypothetical protein